MWQEMTDSSLTLASLWKNKVVNVTLGDALPKRGNRVTRAIATNILALFGWRLEGELPDQPKMMLIGAPHTSNWDMVLGMVVIWAMGLELFWMGKQSAFRWPYGGFFRWLGGVPVNRRVPQGVVGQTIAEYKRRDKYLLVIMPEGTRAGEARWKTGFYHIATGAGVPILPVKFDYGRKIMGFGPSFFPAGNISGEMENIQSLFAGIQGKCTQKEYKFR
jgi:1-acyl-sn-glycerol-3-phosphate acyltransferase